jgi:hypothetical protein
MKIAKSFFAAVLLIGSVGVTYAAAVAPGVISSAVSTPGSYCHLRFPAIREDTLASNRPVLKDAREGDIVDFYGSCDHDPLGKDEIESQRQQAAERYNND